MLRNAQQIGVVDGADDVCTFPVDSIDSQVYGMGWDAGYCLHQYGIAAQRKNFVRYITCPREWDIDAGREEPEQ